ncbi:MAG: hypothetical protein FIB01_01200 [Gemmatimonadetes bacterium]|nr:hypothetical protein [Gemmatimonadota bacterium]
MRRARRTASYVGFGAVALLALALVAVQLFTRSDWGMERARRYALGWLAERVHGTVTIGRISGDGLLDGAVLHDVSISDRRGRPFLLVDSARAAYRWRTLLAGRIVLDRVALYQPRVFLEKLPGDSAWNYQLLFADTAPRPRTGPPQRRLVRIGQAEIIGGEATIRTPLPAGRLQPQDTARLILERYAAGLAKLMRFQGIDAALGRVLWESPQDSGRLVEVERATATAYVFRRPFPLSHARGDVALRDSIVSLDFPQVELPASTTAIAGTVVAGDGRNYYDLQIDSRQFAFRDLQWLSDRLPADGGGSGRLQIQSQRALNSTLWLAEDARIRTGGSSIAGTLGVVLGDTTYFTRVDLRASPLDVALLQRLLPGGVPFEGVAVGTVEAEGPLFALKTSGDLRLASDAAQARAGGSGVRWDGVLDVRRGRLGAQQLHAELQRFDLELLNVWQPRLRLGGSVSGQVSATGRFASDLRFTADLRHLQPSGDTSRLVGTGTLVGPAAARALELELEARPFALAELARRYPALSGLQGSATGHVSLRGPFDRLTYDAALSTGAGPVHLRGQLSRDSDGPRYAGSAELSAFQLDALSPRLPRANLNGTVAFDVTGTGLGSLHGDVRVRLDSAHVLRVPLQRSQLEARLADGLLLVDSLSAATLAGELTARGSLGLVPERTGSLSVDLRNAAVGLLEADIFGEAASTEPEAPRLAGSVRVQGELRGNLGRLHATAEGDVRQLVVGPLRVAHGRARFVASALGGDSMHAELAVSADSAAAWSQLLDTATAALVQNAGTTSIALRGGGRSAPTDRFELQGWLRRDPERTTAAITRLTLGDTASWQLADSVTLQLADGTLSFSPINFRRQDGRGGLRAEGVLGWSSDSLAARPLDFRLQLAAVPFPDLLRAARSPAAGAGALDGALRITGTTLAPLVDGNLTANGLAYDEVNVQHGFLELNFADQDAELFLEAQHGSRRVLSGGGRIPLDLRFTGVKQRRLARPLNFSITADSLPAAQVLPFFDGFRQVEGWLDGTIKAGGTTLDPALSGGLQAERLAATWNATGVRYRDLNGTFDINDRTVQVNARTRTRDPRRDGATGTGSVTGTLDFVRLSNPAFDLRFRADNLLAAQRRDVEAALTGDIHLGGRYAAPEVSGSLRVERGVMYLDEVYRQFFVVQLDSASMFQFVDTSLVAGRRVLPITSNPFLDNLRIDSTRISVGSGSWLRSQDMDVEVQGDLGLVFDRRADDLRLSGPLDVVRGTYQLVYPPLQARRFQVNEGTIEFTGLPGIDPNLLITALYKGRAGNEPLDIVAEVSGTLQNPRVRLTSDEEPPISESDLASYLFFGVPTWEMGNLVGIQSGDTRGTLTGLGRTFAPSLLGYASSGLQTLAQGAGLLDYVSLTAANALPGTAAADNARERAGLFSSAQLELGRYFTPRLYVGVSQRLAYATSNPAVRLEWRFRPTATLELFSEDRFARGSAGAGFNQEGMMRRVYGFFLYREWDY